MRETKRTQARVVRRQRSVRHLGRGSDHIGITPAQTAFFEKLFQKASKSFCQGKAVRPVLQSVLQSLVSNQLRQRPLNFVSHRQNMLTAERQPQKSNYDFRNERPAQHDRLVAF